jgi:hypothetical protein
MNLFCLATADDVLRRAAWTTRSGDFHRSLVRLVGCLVLFGLIYGAVMGTFRGLAGQSQWLVQIVYSAVKVPLLLLASFSISLPSFFVLSTLLGLRKDFGQSLRAVVATQAGLAVVLASLAPLTMLWYASSADYQSALLFNGLMFALASVAAQWLLRTYYRPLVARSPRHRWLLWGWLLVYAFVAIQMAWLLRPFIGAPTIEVQFLRPEAWDNAYVVVTRLVWRALGG